MSIEQPSTTDKQRISSDIKREKGHTVKSYRKQDNLKGNCRVGHHFSGKPCKCFPYCDTTKKYILSDLFGSEIAIESVQFAAHSIFRH